MSQSAVIICFRNSDGKIVPDDGSYELSEFAGIVPSIGDRILEPGIRNGLDRHQLVNRRIWTVVDRYFYARDTAGQVALVVEERVPDESEAALIR